MYILTVNDKILYCTVKNIGGKKLWQIKAICQVLLPNFTISITFPMQIDFNLPKFFHQTSYSPAKVFYYIAQQELTMRHNPAILEILNKAATL